MSQLSASGGQSIGVSTSTSVLQMNTQDWSPLGWTGWISLQSKRFSRVFSSTTFQKHQSFDTQLPYGPTLTFIHDYWKNHSFDYTDQWGWVLAAWRILPPKLPHLFFFFSWQHHCFFKIGPQDWHTKIIEVQQPSFIASVVPATSVRSKLINTTDTISEQNVGKLTPKGERFLSI